MTFVDAHRLVLKYITENDVFVPDRISDGKMLRIIKTKLHNGMVTQQPPTTTVVETITTIEQQHPTMVQTTTMPMHTQVNTLSYPRTNLMPTAFGVSNGINLPNKVVNMRQMPIMVGGSRVVEGQINPTWLPGSNVFAGQRPIAVGVNQVGLVNPIQSSSTVSNSRAILSPPSLTSYPNE
jgi:hypothetical protein